MRLITGATLARVCQERQPQADVLYNLEGGLAVACAMIPAILPGGDLPP